MSSTTVGPAAGTTPAGTTPAGAKKETAYSGPGPQAKQAPKAGFYNGMPPGTTGALRG